MPDKKPMTNPGAKPKPMETKPGTPKKKPTSAPPKR